MPIAVDPHVARAWIERVRGGEAERVEDELAIEEPLEIRVDGAPLVVTMRTPGEDEELAVGFLAGEGLIAGREDIDAVGPTDDLAANVVDVRTRAGLRRDPGTRNFYTTSSCGVCGKGALESVRVEAGEPLQQPAVDPSLVASAPTRARAEQTAFERTGGLHATALFDAESAELVVVREDVGRHNAMDKALGSQLLAGRYPLPGVVACLSGRASFELVQKAALAGLAGIVAVGAPSRLAVELAREREMLLCGFVKADSFNLYSGTLHL
ncbi:MAG: FdhD protein [Thermoleophilaceae bacterium]|nr:FdhD protein [Thermoleophilaceae bacterium]